MDTVRVVDVMGIIAGLGALVVVVFAWPRRRSDAVRHRHPSAGPPFSLAFEPAGPSWRFSVRQGRPPVAIDILTHRPAGTGEWSSEPFVEPIVVRPGTEVAIVATVADATVGHDVVVAWTVQHATGPVEGSRTMTVGTTPPATNAPAPVAGAGLAPRIALGSIAVFLALITMVLGLRVFGDTSESSERSTAVPASTSPLTSDVVRDLVPTVATTTTPTSTSPTSTSPASTSPASSSVPGRGSIAGTASPASTSVAPTTTTTATATTVDAATTPPESTTVRTSEVASTTSPAPDGPAVAVDGRVDDCRFGTDCLIVGFTLAGFDGSGEYVCEFGDGSRFVFRYLGDGADDACVTGGDDAAITIEVDGVRSRTVTRQRLDGE